MFYFSKLKIINYNRYIKKLAHGIQVIIEQNDSGTIGNTMTCNNIPSRSTVTCCRVT